MSASALPRPQPPVLAQQPQQLPQPHSQPQQAKASDDAGLKVRVTAARFVASWRWSVAAADEVCGICRLPFECCCPSCRFGGDECPPIVGACRHAYHLHCIHSWLAAKDKEQVCPLCRRAWE